ncbi:WW domain-containing oxidoreductase [Nymphon striatum]|nr:WW domain-containing oxidoreductase [Nymphon striatum]
MSSNIIDTDSEDELPSGWEERATDDGRVYYANHEKKSTQWIHPLTGKKKRVPSDLPYGWECKVTEKGTVYIDHVNQKSTFTDPRLAFAVEENSCPENIRQKYDASSTALQVLHGQDLTGKVIVVTGANCGIGFETAKSLAYHGAHVILACRDLKKAEEAITKIKESRPMHELSLEAMELDLGELKKVKEFASSFKLKHQSLHILILNAGICGNEYMQTVDGYELTFQVNHLSHFYLTQLLTPILVNSAPSRVVVVSSESHRFSGLSKDSFTPEKLSPISASQYSSMKAYGISKLCNIIFANVLDSKLKDKQVRCNSLHPGNMINTSISRSWWVFRLLFLLVRPFTKSLQQGATTSVYCAIHSDLHDVGGLYFNNCCVCPVTDLAEEPTIGDKLWKISEEMIQMALEKY